MRLQTLNGPIRILLVHKKTACDSVTKTLTQAGVLCGMVGATGLEPATSSSRTMRATICATPRFFDFPQVYAIIAVGFLFVNTSLCGLASRPGRERKRGLIAGVLDENVRYHTML